jgi:hypothetical protein
MIAKFARLEFELFARPSKFNFLRWIGNVLPKTHMSLNNQVLPTIVPLKISR